ncbi:NHL repeat-containing protein [Hamadaea tsunoensis]|uniref:hypothetical protein n=1 Tax=Hamadaea tsunoensis TaxID=53368 RepID=UPI00040CBC3A|nr:hypothetical protein [Hamadaea tsunoensis]
MIEEQLQEYAGRTSPPSGLTAERVLSTARTRARRSRLAGGATAVLLVAALAGGVAVAWSRTGTPAEFATAACAVDRLPLPQQLADTVKITGMDPTGRYVLATGGSPAAPVGVMWTDGKPAVLAFTPRSVNSAGLVVGFTGPDTHADDAARRPVRLLGGRLAELPLPTGASGGLAWAVDTAGDVLGSAYFERTGYRAVLWRSGAAAPVVLDGDGLYGEVLTDDGTALGFAADGGRSVRWSPGHAPVPLPLPVGVATATVWSAAGDWATGHGDDENLKGDNGSGPAVRWNLRTGTAELIPGLLGLPVVSTTGVVAGSVGSAYPASGKLPGFWHDGALYALRLPPGVRPAGGGAVAAISADGRTMAGYTQQPATALLWRNC